MSEENYKRGQVERALWRFFTFMKSRSVEPEPRFLIRLKKLLDLDRTAGMIPESEVKHSPRAFAETATEGSGTDAAFTAFDTFCLALGLELLDAGYKQSEIVFLLRHIRKDLMPRYAGIIKHPPAVRQRHRAEPGFPSYQEEGKRYHDYRVFVVIQRLEIKEIFPLLDRRTGGVASDDPVFIRPEFCEGIERLCTLLSDGMPNRYRKALILEMSHTASTVTDFLKKIPPSRRGPP